MHKGVCIGGGGGGKGKIEKMVTKNARNMRKKDPRILSDNPKYPLNKFGQNPKDPPRFPTTVKLDYG